MTNETQAKKARADAAEALRKSGGDPAALNQPSPEQALGVGQSAEERAEDDLGAQGRAGIEGPGPDEPKSSTVASPGMQNDPRVVSGLGAGITSAPLGTPQPVFGGNPITAARDYEWDDDDNTVWGRDQFTGKVIRPRTYPELNKQDVQVLKQAYYLDAVRNPGEIIRDYSGPLASWMQPIDGNGNPIPRNRFKKAA